MKKKDFFSIFFLPLLLLLAFPSSALDIDYPEITASYAFLADAKHDEVLFTQNAYDKAFPASTTKIMTGYLVCLAIDQGIVSLDTMITATEDSTVDLSIYGSSQGISPGETMSVQDLLHCLLVASANEAGNILAIEIAGDLQSFIQSMNDKAAELDCTGTQYRNTHGLHDDEHYTTAYDLYLIFKEAMTHPLFAQIVGTAIYTTKETNQNKERLFYNTNGLLSEWYYRGYTYEYCIGGKTGSTPEAGRCLVSAAEIGNEYVIAVVLGATVAEQEDGSTLLTQLSESRSLLKFGIEQFDRRTITSGTDPVGQIAVTLSDENDAVLVKADGAIEKTLPISMDLSTIDTEVVLHVDTLEAPVAEGMVVGTMYLSYEGEIYGEIDVITMAPVARSEILYQKQQMEGFVTDNGKYMVAGVVATGLAVGGAQYALQKRKRRHSWRNNQKRRYRSNRK
ncbi:MAG: D-alanyl-D-alanine carboxypeptidase family protein [Eubacteriales bacterium]